jgi:acetyltransferase-like isoleucine patch superfamily enzyme
MALPVLAILRTRLRPPLLELRRYYLTRVWGMHIGRGTQISFSAKLDKTNPHGVHIGEHTTVTLGAIVLTHDAVRNRHLDTRIGSDCFIGAGAIIMPGVAIGDGSIIGAGSVVVNDVPPCSLVVGNPAAVVKEVPAGGIPLSSPQPSSASQDSDGRRRSLG